MKLTILLAALLLSLSCSSIFGSRTFAEGDLLVNNVTVHDSSFVLFLNERTDYAPSCAGANVVWNQTEAQVSFVRMQGSTSRDIECPIQTSDAGRRFVRISTEHIAPDDLITVNWMNGRERRRLGSFTR